jgi:hypothetical protein
MNMTQARVDTPDPRIEHAIDELESLITQRFPEARFNVEQGEDPEGTYIWTTVDTDDPDTVLDSIVDRLLEMQIDEGLSVHVIPVRTLERA